MRAKSGFMDDVIKTLDDALNKHGLSDAAASQLAMGNQSAIKNLRMQRGAEKRFNYLTLKKLADALDLELYFGPRRLVTEKSEILADDSDFVQVSRYNVVLSAGDGRAGDNAEPLSPIAFRANWMRDHNLVASSCCVLTVSGDSMHPSLHSGDLVLVDRTTRPIKNLAIYAFSEPSGDVRVKRLEKTDDHLIITSDNPQFPTSIIAQSDANGLSIIGRVVWSGHEF